MNWYLQRGVSFFTVCFHYEVKHETQHNHVHYLLNNFMSLPIKLE